MEVTGPLLPKLSVYAALGVPEIWHVKGDLNSEILHLNADGQYESRTHRAAAPLLTAAILTQ